MSPVRELGEYPGDTYCLRDIVASPCLPTDRCTYQSCDKFKDLVHTIVCIKSTPVSFPWLAWGFDKLLLGLCGSNHMVFQGFCRCLAGVETGKYRLGYFSQAAPRLMGMNPSPLLIRASRARQPCEPFFPLMSAIPSPGSQEVQPWETHPFSCITKTEITLEVFQVIESIEVPKVSCHLWSA